MCWLLIACDLAPTTTWSSAATPSVPISTGITSLEYSSFPAFQEPARYRRASEPLLPRSDTDQTELLEDDVGFITGPYRVEYTGNKFLIYFQNGDSALALTLPGGDGLNILGEDPEIQTLETEYGEKIILTGESNWDATYQASFYTYSYNPGLIRWRLEVMLRKEPAATPEPELQFVDRVSGAETQGHLEIYADRAPMAAPHLYAYSATLDSTLFYWVDLTALNSFMDAARYSPSATPRRLGQRLGHSISRTDLRKLPLQVTIPLYDSYLYLMPGQPEDEDAMFTRYLHNLGDIYDLIAVPEDPLPDWFLPYTNESDLPGKLETEHIQSIQEHTILDLAADKNWVTLANQKYLRAYVADTRQSAEAITLLDVYTGLTRYKMRFGKTPEYYDVLRRAIPEFFNPDFGPQGMFQNSGPLALTGPQERGDTWYELGHALKVAELALWEPADTELRALALRSGDTWIDFAQSVDYVFPQFYSFSTWKGTGREPDAGGGYAYFMLLLNELTGDSLYIDEARRALQALEGYGFRLAYETHMTALTAAAAARMYQIEPDPLYLKVINRAVANLMRLSWIWECDYGWMGSPDAADGSDQEVRRTTNPRTFFGLNPTQQSAVITAKEQYEAWIYLIEVLQRLHGQLDPTVEKLVAEFIKHTLLTIPWSLPPFLPDGAATENPSAYETVSENDLSLYIPLEDLRDGWDLSGVIGQQVYGAGMAPTMAALSLSEIAPGVTIYSGYPLVDIHGMKITFAGISGTSTPVMVLGASYVMGDEDTPIDTEECGDYLCFMAEGGAEYHLFP